MIRKIFKTIILSSSLVLTVTSCDLDQYPNDSISTETSWETVDDAVKFRNGIYSYFKSINGGIYTYTADQQSDLFNATISYSNRGGDMHVGTLQLLNMMLKIFGNIIIIQLIIVIIL